MNKPSIQKEWQALFEKETLNKTHPPAENKTQPKPQLKPLYAPKNEPAANWPGFPPYLRGAQASMYLGKLWTIRQYAGFATAEDSNQFYRQALAAGQKGLSIAFDLPTHRGYDSDHPRVIGDVGKAGVAVDSVEDMKILFDQIPLDKMSVSMTMNGAVIPILANFIVAAEEQGVASHLLQGTLQNDILKEFMVRNTYIYPPQPSMRIVADIIEYCAKHLPKFNTVSISGYHIQEAGATPALELALTLADGQEYIQLALARGLKIDDFAPRLSFFFGIGMNFYMEIAKLRAARLLWSEIITQFGGKNPKSKKLRVHCQTSGWSLARQDPYNNIVRTTIEAMAAVFGGTQSLHTNSFDEAVALPSEFAARIARNTQLILQTETDIDKVIDPWGGSYMMESLTQEMVQQAKQYMQTFATAGGMIQAIEQGLPQNEIEKCAAQKQAGIDSGTEQIVGVNCYQTTEEPIDSLKIDNFAVLDQQTKRLKNLRKTRDSQKVQAILEKMQNAAKNETANLLELAIEACRLRATVGEISLALESVFGRYKASANLIQGVYSRFLKADDSEWKKAIAGTQSFLENFGRRPRLLVAKVGQDGHDRGAKIIATAFSDAGFDIDLSPLFNTPQEVVKQAMENDVHIIGVSTQAAGHLVWLPALVKQLKMQNAEDILVICGGIIPKADHAPLLKAGVKAIFEAGMPIAVMINQVLELLFAETQKP